MRLDGGQYLAIAIRAIDHRPRQRFRFHIQSQTLKRINRTWNSSFVKVLYRQCHMVGESSKRPRAAVDILGTTCVA